MANTNPKPRSAHVAPSSVRQTHFKFRLWHGLVLILLIIVVGVVIIRLSKASGDITNPQAAKTITSSDISRYQAQFGNSSSSKSPLHVTGQVNFNYKGKGSPKFVAYYVDGQLKATPNQAPYTFTLDTTSLSNGQHTIYSVAYDSNDIVSNFIAQNLSVLNGGRLQMIENSFSYPWKVILGDN
jgi:hypothetical protein